MNPMREKKGDGSKVAEVTEVVETPAEGTPRVQPRPSREKDRIVRALRRLGPQLTA